MFGKKAKRIKSLEQELAATRVARDYFHTRFQTYFDMYNETVVKYNQTQQARDSRGRFVVKEIKAEEVPLV